MVNTEKRSIYLDREDAKTVEEEERNLFIRSILEQLGVPLDDIWPNVNLTLDDKITLRSLLSKLEIEILDNNNRGCKIYYKDMLIAEWFKPNFILKKDLSARTLKKQLYYEMIAETYNAISESNKEN
jgi:hypothetical protein